ncbi:putative periplasmic lipoprotein [Brumimicrobium aurantiacum]|uniref:DUF3347 domain-containing protein n=1 Tax=Brumimicrobium aurantiacum TaxID=1737063 RepID=A0A3E1F1F7_9FLAO|nr:hypothetical protein [Brumimicrobium aurantiacum]RFC55579.1 hypothetical protein DXU93_01210 [Brumimicrobium aurantiacum]
MKITYLALICLGFLVACNSSQNTEEISSDSKDAVVISSEIEVGKELETEKDSLPSIENNRLKVNDEMMPFIKEGQLLVTSFEKTGDEDYLNLANELAEQNSKLISSCTMSGGDHDVLHEWLAPHLKLTKDLQNAENIEIANNIVDSLVASYHTFDQNFR